MAAASTCIDFGGIPDLKYLSEDFDLGWVGFRSFGRGLLRPYAAHRDTSMLVFPSGQAKLQFKTGVKKATLSLALDGPNTIKAVAYDRFSNVVAEAQVQNEVVPREEVVRKDEDFTTITLEGDEISRIELKNVLWPGEEPSNYLQKVCLEVDFRELVDLKVQAEIAKGGPLAAFLQDAANTARLDAAFAAVLAVHDGTAEIPAGDEETEKQFFPPDWGCVVNNLIAMVTVSFVVDDLAAATGVATIGDLAETAVVDKVLVVLGFSAGWATAIFWSLVAIGALATAIYTCGRDVPATRPDE